MKVYSQILFTFFILSIAETLILHQFLTSFLTKNIITFKKYYWGICSYFVFQMITYLFQCPLFSTAIYYFLFTIIIASIFFVENIEIKMITSSLFVILNYSCKVFGALVDTTTKKLLIPSVPYELILNARAEIMACLLFLVCVQIIIYFRHLRIQNKLLVYTLIVYIVPTGILYLTTQLFLHRHPTCTTSFYLESGGILLLTSLALFYLLDKSVVIKESSEESTMMKHLMKIQEAYYSKLESSQKEIASMRHDMKNHLVCIYSMLNMEQYDEAKEYIWHLHSKSIHLSSPIQSGNIMIDIILNQSLANLATYNIQTKVHAILPPILQINNVDLCILLGNLLDNATEACNRIQDPSITKFTNLDICIKKNMFYIKISNSFNGVVHLEHNIYHTVKKDQYMCGIGLSNIHKVVNKYHGDINISYTEEVFTVTILLGLDPVIAPSGI